MAPGKTETPRLPQILRALVDTLLDGSLNYGLDASGKVSFFFDEPINEAQLAAEVSLGTPQEIG